MSNVPPIQNKLYGTLNGGPSDAAWIVSHLGIPVMDMFLGTAPGPSKEFLSRIGNRPRHQSMVPASLMRDMADVSSVRQKSERSSFGEGLGYTLSGHI